MGLHYFCLHLLHCNVTLCAFSGRNIADAAETLNIVAVLSNNAFVLSIIVAVLTIIDADLTFPWGLNPF